MHSFYLHTERASASACARAQEDLTEDEPLTHGATQLVRKEGKEEKGMKRPKTWLSQRYEAGGEDQRLEGEGGRN